MYAACKCVVCVGRYAGMLVTMHGRMYWARKGRGNPVGPLFGFSGLQYAIPPVGTYIQYEDENIVK